MPVEALWFGFAALPAGMIAGAVADVAVRRTCVPGGAPARWPTADGGTAGAALVTALCEGALGWRFGLSWSSAVVGVFAVGMVALSDADLRYRRLPTRWCRATGALSVSLMLTASVRGAGVTRLAAAVGAGTLDWCALGVVWWVAGSGRLSVRSERFRRSGRPGHFGRGDLRLAWLAGTCAAWTGPGRLAVLLGAVALLSGCVGALATAARAAWQARSGLVVVPLGPPVVAASLATALWGPGALRSLGLG